MGAHATDAAGAVQHATGAGGALDSGSASSIFRRLHGGAVAQLGERLVRNEEVRGSIPLSSTTPCRFFRKKFLFGLLLERLAACVAGILIHCG